MTAAWMVRAWPGLTGTMNFTRSQPVVNHDRPKNYVISSAT